jgi:glycosyltransferase involved in cell wall biosynthesis
MSPVSAVQPPPLDLAAPMRSLFARGLPIVCFANDWRGDPTSKHHIMRTYAEHTDVLWVESSVSRRPSLSKAHDLRRIGARLKRAAGGLRREGDRLHVASPAGIPLPGSRVARAVNQRLYRTSVRRALRRTGAQGDPLLWVYQPTVAPFLEGMPRSGLVYHCVDRWWAFEEYDTEVMRECHRMLCEQADIVFASAQALLADCLEWTSDAYLVRHGVEWAHFAQAALQPQPRPADIADIEGPVLGFFGLIHEWVDQTLLARIADAFPHATLALIGKVQVDVSELGRRPNVRFLGQKPYAELPAYAARFDVGLIPFVFSDLTLAVNPIKLREYLSAGIPVVATALPEIELLADNPRLRTARTHEQHLAGIRELLAADDPEPGRRDAVLAMAAESWEGRCAEMARLVGEYVRGATA